MKIKRQKKAQRILSFFKHNFGHRPPYQVLLDGTFCQACLQMKVNIRDQLPKYLGDVKLLTTPCCIQEMEALQKMEPKVFGAATVLKQFAIHKCGHDGQAKPAAKCLKAMLGEGNPNRYFIASQDAQVREKARKVPGTPILYLHHSAPTLEKPSEMSEASASKVSHERMTLSYHAKVLAELKKKELGDHDQQETGHRKRKRKGGPNPLSCKKPKKSSKVNKSDNLEQGQVKKRKRKRRKKANETDIQ